jgi:prefoldin beta subunit
MNEISPKLQNQIAQFQQLQQQLQGVLSQKFRMEAQLREAELTIEELNKSGEEVPVYKSIGSLLVRSKDKASVLKEVEEDKETLEVRIKTLDRQEKQLREKYNTMQEQLSKALGGPEAPSKNEN